ncbi:alpha-amylase family glycosyl hydrolase [Corallincola spongiicola]|uniref:Pullulanase n=1 Tax=Corallincola spongiicola TaxID=2520508 RepID=A0ABY1WP89_9GAMM|nr:alpha-amylase family glycosyl hydrolase [Corallincola spongiicola]TAA45896.1 pullulanase [Corallincola spongiicola]
MNIKLLRTPAKRLCAITIAAGLLVPNAYADWFFRGTPNGWATTALTAGSGTELTLCQSFGNGDGNGGPRFKIDRYGDWSENYPGADYSVAGNASYQITFFSDSHDLDVVPVASCDEDPDGFKKNFTSLNFRGTANGWTATPMVLVADNTWELEVNLDGQPNQRFKFDLYGDWATNYGDNNADGVLEQTGGDIFNTGSGDYKITVNDLSLAYTVTPLDICVEDCCETDCCETDCGGDEVATLGAVYSADKTTFSIWSPDHSNVELRLDGQTYAMAKVAEFEGYNDVYQVTVDGDWHLKTYSFMINDIAVRDPYGKMVEPNTQNNIVMDMSRTDLAADWAPTPAFAAREDAVIYEVHIRDFTIHASAGVSAEKRGKFLGMVEPGTRYNSVATGIDHLKELGVTHVQLLPVYDFGSCPDLADTDCYNWGYDPRNFNVPEERYSQTPYDYENRAREFKQMVDGFHKAGIRVVMDVVYNHTYADEMFENITDKYYTDSDLSGTGNSVDANVPMVSRMIRDSLEYWVREYNIDGFRFDLIGIFDYDEVGEWGRHLNATFPDRNLLIYGEPWNGYASDPREAERVRLGTIGRIADARVGVFNPKFREAIKGLNDQAGCNAGDCFAFNNNPDVWRIEVGSRGAIRYSNSNPNEAIDTWDPMFAMDPEQTINYVSAHDNLALRDKILQWADLNGVSRSSTYLRRIQMFANGIVLTSQGVPFLHGGVEIMRDKQEDHNSYRSPDSINQYYWNWKQDNADVFAYYQDVIAMRNAHPGFRLTSWDAINNDVISERPRYGVLVNRIAAEYHGDSWKQIIVIYNSSDNFTYQLPSGTWKVAMEKSDPAAGNGRQVSGSIVAEGTAVTVLYQD